MSDEEIFNKLVEEKLKTFIGFIDFDGNNCHDCAGWNEGVPECSGWDGRSRRCECGNRRVDWVLSSCKTYVYAEAY